MPIWIWILCAVIVAGVILVGFVGYRMWLVRRAGTPMLLRPLPANADEGWRHGAVHYTDDALLYYRLTSWRTGPSVSLSRRRIDVGRRRAPVGTELEIMDDDFVVTEVGVGRGGRGASYELAMAPELMTAFQSWIEARSPKRARRRPAA